MTMPRLEASTLMKFVEQRGGLPAVVQAHLHRELLLGNISKDQADIEITQHPLYERLKRAFTRARESGVFTIFWVDDFTCTYLQLHPSEVYGNAWFEA